MSANDVLESIELQVQGRTFALRPCGGPGGLPGPLAPPRRLESQAMRWSYVLRTRERWIDKPGANETQEEDATTTLREFGLDAEALRHLASAGRVVVKMSYRGEGLGWAGRVFPWEYVIAAATRRYRRPHGLHVTVMRELEPPRDAAPGWRAGHAPGRVLLVQSAPGGLRSTWEFTDEVQRLRTALRRYDIEALEDPTWQQLHDTVRRFRPDLIHVTGFDNLRGLKALRDVAGPLEPVETQFEPMSIADLLSDERNVPDGLLLAGGAAAAAVVDAQRLAEALNAGGTHCAYFIGFSTGNSAARTAALAVAERAAVSAVGFQDAVDNELGDFFFELIYAQLAAARYWDAPLAFEQAWLRVRQERRAMRATGIAFWGGDALLPRVASAHPATAAELGASDRGPELQCTPETEVNYAVLHNNGQLFRRFTIERGNAKPDDWLDVDVALHVGAEPARFSRRFRASESRFDLKRDIHLPLTANLIRSLLEAVNTTLVVELAHNGQPLTRETYPLRLLPVDQWRDNDKDGQWLPSFVLPRDRAVTQVMEQAQRYVRVLRDDPSAGFEGYQAAPNPADEEQLREVDLQVQAIWATLIHDWHLGYINPPPGYSSKLDSQRLRTPSTLRAAGAGTCIDLALLFAACLELIDVYPVVFLLNGHALPGYWRHQSFQQDFQSLSGASSTAGMDGDPNASGSRQKFSWQALGAGAHRELQQFIRARQLVPIETVRLTERCGFVEAIEAGIAALSEAGDFHSILDIVAARASGITPLPLTGVVE